MSKPLPPAERLFTLQEAFEIYDAGQGYTTTAASEVNRKKQYFQSKFNIDITRK